MRIANVLAAMISAATVAVLVSAPSSAQTTSQPPACQAEPLMASDAIAGSIDIAGESKTITLTSAPLKNDGAVLWRIEKNGAPTSYLLGTIHSTDPRINELSDAFKAVLADVSQVALEIAGDDAEVVMARLMAEKPELFVYIDGSSLADRLDDGQMAALSKALASAGIPGPMAPMMRPWMSSMMLAIPDCERKRIGANIPVLDEKIGQLARAKGATVVSLETVESQSRALGGLPEPDQLAMLKATLAVVDRIPALNETITQFYLARRIGDVWRLNLALAKAASIDAKSFSSFEQAVIVKRNIGMAENALPLMEKASTLVAVGALHLVGDTGLVALFRKAGYTVTPLE